MARATLTPISVPGPYATAGAAVAFAAADATNYNRIRLTGREIVLARNTGVSAATVTVTSVSLNGRTGDISADSIAADAIHVYQQFPLPGWQQTDGYLYLEASSADIEFAVLKL